VTHIKWKPLPRRGARVPRPKILQRLKSQDLHLAMLYDRSLEGRGADCSRKVARSAGRAAAVAGVQSAG
jgi:hypothetical protein